MSQQVSASLAKLQNQVVNLTGRHGLILRKEEAYSIEDSFSTHLEPHKDNKAHMEHEDIVLGFWVQGLGLRGWCTKISVQRR